MQKSKIVEQKNIEKEKRMKEFARNWVLLCLEQLGYTKLLPNQSLQSSAIEIIEKDSFLKKYEKK